MKKKSVDIINNVKAYEEKMLNQANHNIQGRAFDLCNDYFNNFGIKNGTLIGDNLQISCLQLWSFLANWGMFRGSSKIIQRNNSCLQSLIIHFNNVDKTLWNIDVDNYQKDNNTNLLLFEYKAIADELKNIEITPTVTLVTKIMMGVYASIPAFDENFTNAFRIIYGDDEKKCGFRSFNEQSLNCIADFYNNHKHEIDECQKKFKIKDFTGKETNRLYSKAKIIDMFGFVFGQKKKYVLNQ